MERELQYGKNSLPFERVIIPYHCIEPGDDAIRPEYLELRKDPITGFWNKINPFKKVRKINKSEYILMISADKTCPFCKQNINKLLRLSIDNRFKISKLSRQNSILFVPDKLYSKYHAIVIPTVEKHAEFIDEIPVYDLIISFKLIKEFVSSNYRNDSSSKFVYIHLNHTLLAGASQQHLHFQIEQNTIPTNYHRILLEKTKEHFARFKSSLVEDYVQSELNFKDRVIYSGKFIDWVASFSPFGHHDVLGLVKSFGIFNMAEINLEGFVKELYEFLVKYIDTLDLIAFNMSIIDSTFVKEPGVYPIIRIASRFSSEQGTTAEGYLETLHLEKLAYTLPEETAREIRKAFE